MGLESRYIAYWHHDDCAAHVVGIQLLVNTRNGLYPFHFIAVYTGSYYQDWTPYLTGCIQNGQLP